MDYEQERRHILSLVAEGTMTPGDAAERLAVLEEAQRSDPGPDAGGVRTDVRREVRREFRREVRDARREARGSERGEPATGDGDAGKVQRISVIGSLRAVEVIGDPAVREAVADGPHAAYRRGDSLVIETEGPDWSGNIDDGFQFLRDKGRGMVFNVRRHMTQGGVKVRVNPDLPLRVEVQAGSMRVADVHGPITAEVDAGALRIRNFVGPIKVEVNAGSFTGSGVLAEGTSRIECNAGKVDLALDPGTSVQVKAKVELGKLSLAEKGDRGGVEIGEAGTARLDLEVNLGAAVVRRSDDA